MPPPRTKAPRPGPLPSRERDATAKRAFWRTSRVASTGASISVRARAGAQNGGARGRRRGGDDGGDAAGLTEEPRNAAELDDLPLNLRVVVARRACAAVHVRSSSRRRSAHPSRRGGVSVAGAARGCA